MNIKRIFLLILCCIVCTTVHSQDRDYQISGRTFNYYYFKISRPNYYPIIFSAIQEVGDTLEVNTQSVKDCIMSIISTTRSAPVSLSECYDLFYRIWGEDYQTRLFVDSLDIDFSQRLDDIGIKEECKLGTGETLTVQYAQCRGLVVDTVTDHSLSIGLSSTDYQILKNRTIPIAILQYKRIENMIKFK